MKRIAATFILLVFLFNVVGYYAVYLGLKAQASYEIKQRLDEEDYNEKETTTLRIPLTLPYQSDWRSFERVDGEFEKNGQFYSLVKQKVERDTLIVVIIKDQKKTSLFESLTEFVHASTDTPLSKKAGKLIEVFTKDFLSTTNDLEKRSTGWSVEKGFSHQDFLLINSFKRIFSPPPQPVG